MLIVFMFLIGAAGSAAMTNVAGTITDLFGDNDIAGQAMALFVVSANCGPSIGPPIGHWITNNSQLGWRWIYHFNTIIAAVFALGMVFIPETLPRSVILARAKQAGELELEDMKQLAQTSTLWSKFTFFFGMTFKLMLTEPIILTLALFNGFAYGLVFLYLEGLHAVFVENNGLS